MAGANPNPDKSASTAVSLYLQTYNYVQLASWAYILWFLKDAVLVTIDLSFSAHIQAKGPQTVAEASLRFYDAMLPILQINQLASWLELVHAILGWTKSRYPYYVLKNIK